MFARRRGRGRRAGRSAREERRAKSEAVCSGNVVQLRSPTCCCMLLLLLRGEGRECVHTYIHTYIPTPTSPRQFFPPSPFLSPQCPPSIINSPKPPTIKQHPTKLTILNAPRSRASKMATATVLSRQETEAVTGPQRARRSMKQALKMTVGSTIGDECVEGRECQGRSWTRRVAGSEFAG